MLHLLFFSALAAAAPSDFAGSYAGTISNNGSVAEVNAEVTDGLVASISTGEGLVVNLGVCGTLAIEPRSFDVTFTLEGDVARGQSTWPILGLDLPMALEIRSDGDTDKLRGTATVDAPFFCGDVVLDLRLQRQ